MLRSRSMRHGFTLVELLVVIAIIGILVGLLLPAVQAAREAARRMSCSNNFKQIGLAVHNYHSAYKNLPTSLTGTNDKAGNPDDSLNTSRRSLSFLVGILPFVEQQALWEKIANPSQETTPGTTMPAGVDGTPQAWPPMGPAPWVREYRPWATSVPTFRCPSDPGQSRGGGLGRSNYAACLGDSIDLVSHGGVNEVGWFQNSFTGGDTTDADWVATRARSSCRGFFWQRQEMKFRDVLDGLANTICAGEICTSGGKREIKADYVRDIDYTVLHERVATPSLCNEGAHIDATRPQFYATGASVDTDSNDLHGARWADGKPRYTSFHTILPPNRPSCTDDGGDTGRYQMTTAGSRHNGGCHILMGDGAVIFITESVEAGQLGNPGTVVKDGDGTIGLPAGTESPFGLWGALGTRDIGETIEEELNQ